MATTADHNTNTGTALASLDDAEFAAEFGLDIGAETDDATATAEIEPEQDETEEDAPEVEGDDTAPEADEGEEAEGEEPEAPVAEEPKKLLTSFTVKDDTGAETEIPSLKLSFKAGGKMQEDLPLDKVVRLAQSGFYAEQMGAERDQLKKELPEIQTRAERLEAALEDQKALNARMLEDEDFFLQAREQYAAVNTPEHRAQRAEAKLRETEQRQQQVRLVEEANGFVQNAVTPILTRLAEEYPTVTVEELYGRLTIETAPLLRNGVIPRQHWNEVTRLLESSVAQYAEAQHARRDGDRVKATQKATKEVTKAQETATKAKRVLAKAMAPAGKGTVKAKPPAIRTAEDAADAVIADIKSMVFG